MIWEKKIHTVAPKKRLLPGAGFPPGTADALHCDQKIRRSNQAVYLTPTTTAVGALLSTWAPYLDSAYCVSAEHLSEYGVLKEWVSLFETDVRAAVLAADILFILNIDRASQDDIDYVLYLIGRRLRSGKIIKIDME